MFDREIFTDIHDNSPRSRISLKTPRKQAVLKRWLKFLLALLPWSVGAWSPIPEIFVKDGQSLEWGPAERIFALALRVGTNSSAGSLTISGAQVRTMTVQVQGVSQSRLVFNSGILTTTRCTITNGIAQVIGNGTDPACLELDGGSGAPLVSTFSGGLVINTNAELKCKGNVTIVGNVQNYGTISTTGTLLFEPSDQYPSSLDNYCTLRTDGGVMMFRGRFTDWMR